MPKGPTNLGHLGRQDLPSLAPTWGFEANGPSKQELVYYLKSMELLGGLARGRGSHSLITKPFVAGGSMWARDRANGLGDLVCRANGTGRVAGVGA